MSWLLLLVETCLMFLPVKVFMSLLTSCNKNWTATLEVFLRDCMNMAYLDRSIVSACMPLRGSMRFLWVERGRSHMCLTDTDQLFTTCLVMSPVRSQRDEP